MRDPVHSVRGRAKDEGMHIGSARDATTRIQVRLDDASEQVGDLGWGYGTGHGDVREVRTDARRSRNVLFLFEKKFSGVTSVAQVSVA